MLFLFAFFFWRFCPVSANVLNFSSLHPRVPGYCVYMDKHLSRLIEISIASTGTRSGWTFRSPYKHNCENNSKLSTSRDLGVPGSYKQALSFLSTLFIIHDQSRQERSSLDRSNAKIKSYLNECTHFLHLSEICPSWIDFSRIYYKKYSKVRYFHTSILPCLFGLNIYRRHRC